MTSSILVVGGAGGVGLEVTKLLIARGDRVICTVLNENEADIVRRSAPGTARLITLDLSDADAIKPVLVRTLNEAGSSLSAAIVCAAIFPPIRVLEYLPLAILRSTLEINTISNVAIYQACMPFLRETKGRMVLISSYSGRSASPGTGPYSASKFALEGLGDAMRREAAKFGVDIVLIEPGSIRTNMVMQQLGSIDGFIASLDKVERRLYGDLYQKFQALMGRLPASIEPAEVAEVIISVLQADHPQTRYQVGQDAVDIIKLARNGTDLETDEFYEKLLDGKL